MLGLSCLCSIVYKALDFKNTVFWLDEDFFLISSMFWLVVPMLFSVTEAWSNALLKTMFRQVESDDYNRKLGEQESLFDKLRRKTTDDVTVPSLRKKKTFKQKFRNFCCYFSQKSINRRRRRELKRKMRL